MPKQDVKDNPDPAEVAGHEATIKLAIGNLVKTSELPPSWRRDRAVALQAHTVAQIAFETTAPIEVIAAALAEQLTRIINATISGEPVTAGVSLPFDPTYRGRGDPNDDDTA